MSAIDRAALIRALPYARRYARALTGSQTRGDAVVADALRRVLAMAGSDLTEDASARVALYGAIGDQVRAGEGDADAAADDMSQTQRMLLLLTDLDPVTAFTAILASVHCMGPGLGTVGPSTNYASLTDFQSWVCTLAMILGRLEIIPVLVICTRTFWRK